MILGVTFITIVFVLAYFEKIDLISRVLWWTKIDTLIFTFILILFNVFIAKVLPLKGIEKIGQHTIVCCGMEAVIKDILKVFGSVLGLEFQIKQPWQVIIYSLLCLWVVEKYVYKWYYSLDKKLSDIYKQFRKEQLN